MTIDGAEVLLVLGIPTAEPWNSLTETVHPVTTSKPDASRIRAGAAARW